MHLVVIIHCYHKYFTWEFFVWKIRAEAEISRYNGMDHFPIFDSIKPFRSRCKLPGCIYFSSFLCENCRVHLCITSKRNCFYDYHHQQTIRNEASCQNKRAKKSRQTIESVTVTNGERTGRRLTESNATESPKCRQNKRKNELKVVKISRKTRLVRRTMCAERLERRAMCAESATSRNYFISTRSSKKMDFMSSIGLARVERPGKNRRRWRSIAEARRKIGAEDDSAT